MVGRMPPAEPLVAGHLQPRPTVLSGNPSLKSKSDCFQSALTAKAYKAEGFWVNWDQAAWEKLIISDLCLRVQRCTVQAKGGAMGTLVLYE